MKRSLLIMLLSCLTVQAFSQKCKFERSEYDEFTGARIIETFVVNLKPVKMLSFKGASYFIYLGFAQHNKNIYVRAVLSSLTPYIIDETSYLYIKFEDGTILKFKTKSANLDVTPTYNYTTRLTAYGVINLYPATLEDVGTIMEKKAVKVRMDTSDSYSESELTKKSSKLLQETASCFLHESRGFIN